MKINVTLLHMGDSITFGQYVDPTLRWTTLVANQLTAKYADSIVLNSLNHGVSGETTRMGLERYPKDVQTTEAHIQTLQFGMNDCNCWQTDRGLPRVSEAAFRANLHEMIRRSRRFGIENIIMLTNPRSLKEFPAQGESYDEANARYSRILSEVADAEKLPLCDIRKAFDEMSMETLTASLLPAPDLLHLSPLGNQFYADLVAPYIDELLLSMAGQKS